MKLDFLGHAAFLLTTSSGTRVLFDPYESGGFDGRVGYGQIDMPVDVVIITHDHLDHCHVDALPPGFETIRHAGRVRDVDVRSVEAFHDRHQGERFGGTVDMKVVALDEGITVCHAGDLGEDLSADHLDALGDIDVFIPPVGGYYTLDADGAARACRALAPRVVVPCHYKTARCGFDIAPVEPFLAHFERVQEPGGSEWVCSADSVPDRLTIVHLHPRL